LVVDVRGTPDAQPVAPLATLLQAASLTEQIQLHIAPSAFTQVNWPVNQAIVAELLEGVDKRELHTFADLYSGIGNFSLPLLARGLTGVGVEESPLSVALARLAASKHGFTLGHFIAEDVANTVRSWAQEARRFDLVVVDPPRSGATQTTAAIAAIAQRYLFLCACDPVTFARDIRDYLAAGFQLESLRIHDMFPQTHHFEVTAWLRR
jgi:23S rRNA (uracil1939-C5)-methyltransferase